MTNSPNLIDGPFIAFHGDKELQAKMLASVDAHIKADQIIQGEYGRYADPEAKTGFEGCFIGCTIHALKNGNTEEFNDNEGVFEAYGFPAPLTRICEKIFEGLPSKGAPSFFHDVPNAVKNGADISLVHWKFLHWMLKDTLQKHGTPEVRKGCSKSLAVIRDLAKGKKVAERRARAAARAAADAAYAAYAADAADAAAYVAADAAYAAYASYAVADAVADAAAYVEPKDTRAARKDRYKEFAAQLLIILGEAS